MEVPDPPRLQSSATRSASAGAAPLATASRGGDPPGGPGGPGGVRPGAGAATAAAEEEGSSVVPPYWQRHRRDVSTISLDPSRRSLIRLEDHTIEGSEQAKALWAKQVTMDDYVIVSGNAPGVGSYVVWSCTVETLDGGNMKIRKRYSEFDELRSHLVRTFPHCEGAIPQLPPKSLISRFRPRFLERRKEGLSYFLNCVLLNPEFAGSPVLKDFLFDSANY